MVSSIEAPLALLPKPVKAGWLNTVEFAQVTLGLIPEVLDSIDVVFLVRKLHRVVDAFVVKIAHIEGIVAAPCVGVNDAVGLHSFRDDRQECLGLCVGNDCCVNLATTLE